LSLPTCRASIEASDQIANAIREQNKKMPAAIERAGSFKRCTMKDVSDSARQRNGKNAAECRRDEAPLVPIGALKDAHVRWANNDRRLTPSTRAVALTLLAIYTNTKLYKSREVLVVWPTVRALAKDCGINKDTAVASIKRLVKTGHLVPWTEPVPRREDPQNRPSNAYAFGDLPPMILLNWADFDGLDDDHGGKRPLSEYESDKGSTDLCPNLSRTKGRGALSESSETFVRISGGALSESHPEEVPENIGFGDYTYEVDTLKLNSTNPDSADSGARNDSNAVPVTNGHTARAESAGKSVSNGRARESRSEPDYVFGTTIKLTAKQFHQWELAYPHINVRGKLFRFDEWAGELKAKGENWFCAVSNALDNANRKAKAEVERIRAEAEATAKLKAAPKRYQVIL
jgi:hypothetical protein